MRNPTLGQDLPAPRFLRCDTFGKHRATRGGEIVCGVNKIFQHDFVLFSLVDIAAQMARA
jgi:hypothetical protein